MVDKARPQTSAVNEDVTASRPAVVLVRERNWWLIAGVCVLVVLLAAASVLALQQHNAANNWAHDDHVEVSDYHAEFRKNVELYSSLVLAQQRFSTCGTDANRILFDLDAYFQRGFLPISSKSDATTAGQACQTPTHGTGS